MRNSKSLTSRTRLALLAGILVVLCICMPQVLPHNTGEEAECDRVLNREENEDEASSSRIDAGRRQRSGSLVGENARLNNLVSRHFESVFAENEASLRIYQTEDFLLIRAGWLMGVAELGLLESGGEGNLELIREMKTRLLDSTIKQLTSGIEEVTGLKLKESYVSYSPTDDEMMVVLNIDTAKEVV